MNGSKHIVIRYFKRVHEVSTRSGSDWVAFDDVPGRYRSRYWLCHARGANRPHCVEWQRRL